MLTGYADPNPDRVEMKYTKIKVHQIPILITTTGGEKFREMVHKKGRIQIFTDLSKM